jgi:hypothetical protein
VGAIARKSKSQNPLVDGVLQVNAQQCDTCIFKKGSIFNDEMLPRLMDAKKRGTVMACHSACWRIPGYDEPAVCHEFWRQHMGFEATHQRIVRTPTGDVPIRLVNEHTSTTK